jgi:hypothetical protein
MNRETKQAILETTIKDWKTDLDRLYDQAYWQGYNDRAILDLNNFQPLAGAKFKGCQVCGLDMTKGAWGYVCPRDDCPTRITCKSQV